MQCSCNIFETEVCVLILKIQTQKNKQANKWFFLSVGFVFKSQFESDKTKVFGLSLELCVYMYVYMYVCKESISEQIINK